MPGGAGRASWNAGGSPTMRPCNRGPVMRFAGSSVLIVGAATGLGAATAEAFAGEGAALTLVDRDGARLAGAGTAARPPATGAKVTEIAGDAAMQTTAGMAIEACLAAHGAIDVLFNNAGIDPLTATTVAHTTEAQWDAIMAVNVKVVFLLLHGAGPGWRRWGKGAVINTASIAGLRPMGDEVAYAVSKAALIQLTRSIAAEYARQGVRANCICPGFLASGHGHCAAETTPEALAARAAMAARIVPMGRPGRYSETAAAVLFLADPVAAAYITGVALPIDGGQSLA